MPLVVGVSRETGRSPRTHRRRLDRAVCDPLRVRALLVRVGADVTDRGGRWNGPVDSKTREFAYVPIPEARPVRTGYETPYSPFAPAVQRFGRVLPRTLLERTAHLDPDFRHLTYGDRAERARQIQQKIGAGDVLAFYAGLGDIWARRPLVYALIGLYVVESIWPAAIVPRERWHQNAHTRREPVGATEIVVFAQPGASGRLRRCLPFCEFRRRSYRVREDVLEAWGGLSIRDGYVQRSARLPEIRDPRRFLAWFRGQGAELVARNN
jgi:Nucleotide modification associated domain 3